MITLERNLICPKDSVYFKIPINETLKEEKKKKSL